MICLRFRSYKECARIIYSACLIYDFLCLIEYVSCAEQARGKVVDALSLVVRERRRESEEGGERKNDMLAALLAGDGGVGFSDEEIVDFLVSLLVAGYETTSTSMTLAVKFLTETPLALAQLKVG